MCEDFDPYYEADYDFDHDKNYDPYYDMRVMDFLLNVDYIFEQSKLAKSDLRLVKQMEIVADYYKTEIKYARSLNLPHFIINYDENKLLYNFIDKFVNFRNIDIKEFYNFKGAATQGLELPISALLVSWLLPSDVRINVDLDSNGVIFILE